MFGVETQEERQLKLAVLASTINWKVVERYTRKFGYDHASDSFNAPDITPSPVKEEAIVEDDDALSYFAKLAED